MSALRALVICILGILIGLSSAFPEQGKWELEYLKVPKVQQVGIPKSLYAGSEIMITITCISKEAEMPLSITWALTELQCWNEYLRYGDDETEKSRTSLNLTINPPSISTKCTAHIVLEEFKNDGTAKLVAVDTDKNKLPKDVSLKSDNVKDNLLDEKSSSALVAEKAKTKVKREMPGDIDAEPPGEATKIDHPKALKSNDNRPNRVYTITADGIYLLNLQIKSVSEMGGPFNLTVEVKMVGPHGYLSAVDWPLLPFYGAMCVVYVMLGLAWLIVSFCQWRDLLRIQFWIGGVILLGMLEKATFYAEYQSINSTGMSVRGAVLLAELVSCGKRMLARMLVIIVSLGFGIVKPRLGPMLHRVVFTGVLYFILASVESYLRVMHHKNDPSNQILVASIPLAVLDSAICWWIFTSLVQTTRTLRLRRNLVKLSLYRHFTNTLIFSVVSSVVFMLYSIRFHRLATCLTDWKELWVDDAYWHLLFSVLLLVIMILWRPTNNNQRYAFTPLLDAEDDEEEDEQFINDAFGVKMRGYRSNSPKPKSTNSVEEDLKWVEENIPSSMADTALPILDSDEEIMTTKFEVSKMQ